MYAIEINRLTKTYGQKTAVEDLTLRIKKGTCFGFLGPNGAGKSTTANMLSGLVSPTQGSVHIFGEPLTGRNFKAKDRLGILPENFMLFEHLNFWEHFLMLGPVYGLSVKDSGVRAEELLAFMNLAADRHVLVAEASYGMKKKLSLALALLHNPSILILDEPFEGLDPLASMQIQELFTSLKKKGKTIFLCSHLLGIVEELVEEVAILAHGRLVFQDTMRNMKTQKKNLKQVFVEKAFENVAPAGELAWLA